MLRLAAIRGPPRKSGPRSSFGGEATGTAINPIRISNNEEFESAFAAMERDRPDAIIVQPSLPSKRAAELALQHRVPAVSVKPPASYF
jgi:putative ABC transport system substrate-binding protein